MAAYDPFTMTITNKRTNESHTYNNNNNLGEVLVQYSGLEAVKYEHLSVEMYNRPGASYQGAKADVRNVVLTFYINQNILPNRRRIQRILATGDEVEMVYTDNLYWGDSEQTHTRHLTGVVETVNAPRFAKPDEAKCIVQVSILCYDPYAYSDPITMEHAIKAFLMPSDPASAGWLKSNVIVGTNTQGIKYFDFQGAGAYISCVLAADVEQVIGNRGTIQFYANYDGSPGYFDINFVCNGEVKQSVRKNVTTSTTQYGLPFTILESNFAGCTGPLTLHIRSSTSGMYISRITCTTSLDTFYVRYDGDVPNGLQLTLNAPTSSDRLEGIKLYQADTGYQIALNNIVLCNATGCYKSVTVDTRNMTITGIPYGQSTPVNLITQWTRLNTWLELEPGSRNLYQITADTIQGNTSISIIYSNAYREVI